MHGACSRWGLRRIMLRNHRASVLYSCSHNVLQISFAAASPVLSDRTRFKYYFRTSPSFVHYAPAILGMLNKFRWRRIAFITERENVFLKV